MTLPRLKEISPEYFTVKKSKIDHSGLFSTREILPNQRLIEYTGEMITNLEAERREKENEKKGQTYIFLLNDDSFIDAAVGGNDSKYINHSCDPNCTIVRRKGKIFIHSDRLIKPGEELTIDYSFDKDSKKEICRCGSKNCRSFMNEA